MSKETFKNLQKQMKEQRLSELNSKPIIDKSRTYLNDVENKIKSEIEKLDSRLSQVENKKSTEVHLPKVISMPVQRSVSIPVTIDQGGTGATTAVEARTNLGIPATIGTVTDVSVVTANGVSGTVATSTTTPAITLSLGAITPTSVTPSGMTQGSVYFAGAAGILSQDNANFFWDDSNNRLGIGTNGPGSNLEVSGASGQVAIFKSSSVSDGAYVTFMEGAAVKGYYGAGQGLLTNALADSQAARSQGAFHIATGGDNVRFTVDSASGLVGIGTTGPSELLHLSSTGAARIKIAADTDNATESDVAEILMSQDGVVSTGNIGLNGDNNLVIGANSTTSPNIYFATNSTGTTYASSAEAKMTILNAGNVGINTLVPTQKLDITGYFKFGADYPAGNVRSTNVDKYAEFSVPSYGNTTDILALYSYSSSTDTSFIWGGGSGSKYGATSHAFYTGATSTTLGGTERVKIIANGNVGIATSAPDKALEINHATGANLRLTYNDSNGSASNYADFSTSSSGDLTIAPSGGDTNITGTLSTSGAIILQENAPITLDPAGSADGKYSGTVIVGTAGYTQAFGDVVYLDPTDSRWEACDANAAAGADGDCRGMVGMVVVAGTDGATCTILLNGTIRADAKFPTFTINNPIYISETAGSVTQTQPTTTDAVIRILGAALTADEMYFRPDWTYTTHT